MTNKAYAETLKNCASMLADGIKYMKEEHKKQFREAYEKAIEALSEPTIPLSVIEDIKAEIEERSFNYFAFQTTLWVVPLEDALEIIDKAVKEIE